MARAMPESLRVAKAAYAAAQAAYLAAPSIDALVARTNAREAYRIALDEALETQPQA